VTVLSTVAEETAIAISEATNIANYLRTFLNDTDCPSGQKCTFSARFGARRELIDALGWADYFC
jgi:hypothetical protein